jgi:ADP-ribosylglycohydrolase
MRIAPHVVAHAQAPQHELAPHIVLDGIATHGHPRALVGAAAYASALRILLVAEGTLEFGDLTGLVESDTTWQSPETALSAVPEQWLAAVPRSTSMVHQWEETTVEMRRLLVVAGRATRAGTIGNDMATLDELGAFDRKVNGSGTITAAAAIYLASRNAPRPTGGLLRAAFLENADTDTLASMTGALLGALHGPSWLDSIAGNLQDRAYIERMADACTRLALGEGVPAARFQSTVDERAVRSFTDALRIGHAREHMPDGRSCRLVTDKELLTRGTLRAHRWILDVDGQTFTVDRTAQGSSRKPAEPATPTTQEGVATSGDTRLISVALPAKDLVAIERFYRLGLGVPVARLGPRELEVGSSVHFVEDPSSIAQRQQVLLVFQVHDLVGTAARVGVKLDTKATGFRVVDPMGNQVEVGLTETGRQ